MKRGEKRKSKEIKKDGRRGERVTGEGGEDKAEGRRFPFFQQLNS